MAPTESANYSWYSGSRQIKSYLDNKMKLSTVLFSALVAAIKLSHALPIPHPPSSSPTTSIEEEAQPSVQLETRSPKLSAIARNAAARKLAKDVTNAATKVDVPGGASSAISSKKTTTATRVNPKVSKNINVADDASLAKSKFNNNSV
jgi:hypothetical protein